MLNLGADNSENLGSAISNFGKKINKHKTPFFLLALALLFLLLGLILFYSSGDNSDSKIEVISENMDNEDNLLVEISGAVKNPGVYEMNEGDRVNDLLIVAGGLSEDADLNWTEKMLNRAEKLSDEQKVYIPRKNEQSNVLSASNSGGYQNTSSINSVMGEGLTNVNTASASVLESLWGIGQVTAQNIIEQRPYSNVEELLSRKILKTNVYDRNKNLLTVY